MQKLPLSGYEKGPDGLLQGTGVAFDLIHEIQEKVGFLYNITKPDKNIFGDANTGIIKLLKDEVIRELFNKED